MEMILLRLTGRRNLWTTHMSLQQQTLHTVKWWEVKSVFLGSFVFKNKFMYFHCCQERFPEHLQFLLCGFCRWEESVNHHKVIKASRLLKWVLFCILSFFYHTCIYCHRFIFWRHFTWLLIQWWKWIWKNWNSKICNAVSGCSWGWKVYSGAGSEDKFDFGVIWKCENIEKWQL